MAWVIDTCVLIDVRLDDPAWALRSATCLNARQSEGLVISPVTFVELAPSVPVLLFQLAGDRRDEPCNWTHFKPSHCTDT